MPGLELTVVLEYANVLLWGAWATSVVTVSSSVLSFVVGVLLAVAMLSRHRLLRAPVEFFSWLFLGTPLLLQLYLIYFGLAQIGVDLPALVAGIIGLSLHFAVYNANVIRAGIVAIEAGQYEASRSLGLSHAQAMRKVVVPQAVRNVTPALGNNLIALLKESSLVSIIGVMEVTLSAQWAISETFRPFEFYLAAAAIYYFLNSLFEFALNRIERRVAVTR